MKTKQQKNNSVTVVNKDQIQSYIMTTAKYDFSVYEKRILYRIVEMAQGELQGLHPSDQGYAGLSVRDALPPDPADAARHGTPDAGAGAQRALGHR